MKHKKLLACVLLSVSMSFSVMAGTLSSGFDLDAYNSKATPATEALAEEAKAEEEAAAAAQAEAEAQMKAQAQQAAAAPDAVGQCIIFSKSQHRLDLYENGTLVISYEAASGMAAGDKEVEGDCKTPEGTFYLAKKVPNSAYTLGLLISYPSIEDAERGIATGLISAAQYASIVSANQQKGVPLQKTNLGGEIEIHGCNDVLNDATHGCIILHTQDIIDLYHRVSHGITVKILP